MRITRHQQFMMIAEVIARRSTCYRRNVGCVIVNEAHNILATGYNGPPRGDPHCTGNTCPINGVCQQAVHAEQNAMDRLPLDCVDDELTVYVTESPCLKCAQRLRRSVPIKLFYLHEYRLTEGLDYLVSSGVDVFRMTPSGYIENYATKQLVEEP